jgi:hypothetical protein
MTLKPIPSPTSSQHPHTTGKEIARDVAAGLKLLGGLLITAVKTVWPVEQDIQFLVIVRNGKVKIQFNPPQHKEPGWVDG